MIHPVILKRFAVLALLCGCMLCGCGRQEPEPTAETTASSSDTTKKTTAATRKTTVTTVTTTSPEQYYMEQCEPDMVEVQPKNALTKRKGVTYPKFEKYYYYSHTAKRRTGVNVLLPKDYSEEKKYPVVYILHGSGSNEDWLTSDKIGISVMLTNLIQDGEAEAMIVVTPYIFCSPEMPESTGLDVKNWRIYDNFINDLMKDLRPFINSTFSVDTDRAHTAITGTSAGGRESLYIGFSHPEVFGYTGAVCPASGVVRNVGNPPYTLQPEQFCFEDKRPYLLLISAAEHDEAVGDSPYLYHDILTDNGTQHLFHVMTKSGHDYKSVTSHLYNFFRMIFRAS